MSETTTPLYEAARMLNLGPQKLYRALRHRQVLDKHNIPYRRYVQQGLFTSEVKAYQHPTLGQKLYATAHVTDKGLEWLAKEFEVEITMEQSATHNAPQGATD